MAKRKRVKSKSKTKPRKRRPIPMATRKRRRKSTRRRSTAVRSLSTKPRRRRRRGMLSSSGSLMTSAKGAGAGAIGGAAFVATRLIPMPLYVRTAVGYVGALGAAMFLKMPFVGAGLAGATTANLLQNLLPATMLHDDDLQETNYVDPNTLSDTGMDDENGDPIVMDENGNAFALAEDGTMNDVDMGEGNNMQNVSMVPLFDNNPYALAEQNPYALASGY